LVTLGLVALGLVALALLATTARPEVTTGWRPEASGWPDETE
jgi:hypothetical protein